MIHSLWFFPFLLSIFFFEFFLTILLKEFLKSENKSFLYVNNLQILQHEKVFKLY